MTVNTFYTVGKTIENHDHALIHSGLDEKVIDIIRDCIIYNCDSRVEMSIDAKYSPEGNGTEVAMLRFLQSNDFSIQDLLIQKQREGEHECCIPFGPVRKRQVEVIRPYKGCNYVRVVVKGAPEYVIKYCNKVLTSDGEQREIGEEERDQILQENVIPMAKKGLRTLLYAYKDMDSDHWEDLQAQNNNFVNESDRFIIEEDLTLVAAFGLNDDLRDGVKESIEKLREASINTRMISGDNIHTAIAAAIKAGILLEGEESVPNRCMNGAEFSEAIGGVKLIRDN
jgi:P-type Ca2+ transporter type 2C